MKLLILQISDIHLKNETNIASERVNYIAQAVANVEVEIDAAVIAVSGDIAFSGKSEEYDIARQLLHILKTDLEKRLRNVPLYLVAVPGNHDCSFYPPKSARSILIETIAKEPTGNYDDDIIAQCVAPQKEFFKLIDEVELPKKLNNTSNAFYEYEIPIGESTVLFRCYNTALCSVLHEKPGCLAVPHNLLPPPPVKKHAYIVSMFHHPYNWLSQYNIRTFRKHIESTSDLILTGHEHDADNYAKYTRRGESLQYLEGAAFQESDNEEYSGFNAIWLNLETQHEKIASYTWNKNLFEPNEAKIKWQPFRRTQGRLANDFELTEDTETFLDDPGAKFFHPAKPNLVLRDIFVFPNARIITIEEKKTMREEHVESKDLLKFISNKRRILVSSRERAGKSTLAKVVYADYHAKGFVPVLINGDSITSVELEKFEDLVHKNLTAQYRNPQLPAFDQLDRDQIVIIVDDFDHVPFAAKGRQKILANIHKRFERIVILCDESIRLEELVDAQFTASILTEYAQVTIKDFGYFLRSKLIEKWCRLGSEYTLTEDELECRITRYENLVDAALQRNYLPSIPFFILIYLQSIDASQPVSNSVGSYGNLCEILITRSLATAHKIATLNTKKTYLSEFAYALFKKSSRDFNEEEYTVFHTKHCEKFNIRIDQEKLYRELAESSLLTRQDGRYSFKYPYYYQYFVAYYMHDTLDTEEVRVHVEAMCSKLHKGDNVNIWLFLSHQTKKPLLVDLILAHAKSLFKETPVPQFGDDISFCKRISDSIPAVVLFNRKPEELRESRRRELDAAPTESEISDADYEANDLVRFIAKITDALRTLDVMGQLAKNFSGSLPPKVKFELIDECYRLGLRVIGVILDFWRDDPEKIVNELVDIILSTLSDNDELKKTSREELTKRVKALFFHLTESLCFDMMKRISHAVGSTELIPTFSDVLAATPSNAYKLLDMSVKLDALKLPTNEVVSLNKDIKDNTLCNRLLHRLVVHHIYLFPTDYKTKQKICDELGIPIKELRAIDVLSESQKAVAPTPS